MAALMVALKTAFVVVALASLGGAEQSFQNPDWRYIDNLLSQRLEREPAELVTLLTQEYDQLEEQLVLLTSYPDADSEEAPRKPTGQPTGQQLNDHVETLKSRIIKIRQLIMLSQTRTLESPSFGLRRGPALTPTEIERARDIVKETCKNHDANFDSVLRQLGWQNSFELTDRRAANDYDKPGNLRAYFEYYIRQHYARCPRGLYYWLAKGLSKHASSERPLTKRADELFTRLEGAGSVDEYESALAANEAQLESVCGELRKAIGHVIKIYDTNEMLVGKPYLDDTTGNLLHRWQSRYHLCLSLVGA